jgi:hypothetical protein
MKDLNVKVRRKEVYISPCFPLFHPDALWDV